MIDYNNLMNDLKNNKNEEGHESPTSDPSVGQPKQEVVDASIRTIRYARQSVEQLSGVLMLEEIKKLPDAIDALELSLKSIKIVPKLMDDEELTEAAEIIVGNCEQSDVDGNIDSQKLIEIQQALESVNLEDMTEKLSNAYLYLTQTLLGELANKTMNEINPIKEQLNALKGMLEGPATFDISSPSSIEDVLNWAGKVTKWIKSVIKLIRKPYDLIIRQYNILFKMGTSIGC